LICCASSSRRTACTSGCVSERSSRQRRTNIARTRGPGDSHNANAVTQFASWSAPKPRHAQQQQRMRQPTGAGRPPACVACGSSSHGKVSAIQEIHDRTVSCWRICAPTSSTGRAASMTMISIRLRRGRRARYTLLTLSKNSPLSRSKRSANRFRHCARQARAKACSTPASNRMVRFRAAALPAPCFPTQRWAPRSTGVRRPDTRTSHP